jgi:cytochrome oxidase assembly protein ShyY1
VIPTLFTGVAIITFVALGTWQVERKHWKEALIESVTRRLGAPPIALPPSHSWATLDPADHEFQRVMFSAAFVPNEEALVYAGTPNPQADLSGPGYWVFAPARLVSGDLIVIDRGFVAEGKAPMRDKGEPAGMQKVIGIMRWPQPRGYFTPADNPARNLWFVRDHLAIAAAKSWGSVAPFFIELQSPVPAAGQPRPALTQVNLRNEHLQYAITWYGLALAVTAMFLFWMRTGDRRRTDAR